MPQRILTNLWFVSLLILSFHVSAQNSQAVFSAEKDPVLIGKYLYLIEDADGVLTFEEIQKANTFRKLSDVVPNLNTSSSVFWLRFTVNDSNNITDLVLNIAQPVLDDITFYYPDSNGNYQKIEGGEKLSFNDRKYKEESFIFDINPKIEGSTYYLRIHSGEQLLLPLSIGKRQATFESQNNKRTLFGVYAGIILVMFFYNFFVWASTRDKSYMWYVLHTLFVGLTQASLQGYAFQYLWPNSTWMANHSIFIFLIIRKWYYILHCFEVFNIINIIIYKIIKIF